MYIVTGNFKFKNSKILDARELMDAMVLLGKTEPGIHTYSFYSGLKSSNVFFLYEEWESKQLHDNHFNGPSMKEMLPKFFDLLAEKPKVTYYDATIESKL